MNIKQCNTHIEELESEIKELRIAMKKAKSPEDKTRLHIRIDQRLDIIDRRLIMVHRIKEGVTK
jgi:hypothetical protein